MALRPERSVHACAIHRSDFVVFCKFLTGEWIADLENGEIKSTVLKRNIKFQKSPTGYLHARITHMGRKYDVFKHRAIIIAGMGLFNLPENYFMEVDHINGNKEDCSLKNLRLVTNTENATYAFGLFTYEEADEIRKEFAEGNVTKSELARRYGCHEKTIRNIVEGKTYKRGGN